MNLSRVTKIYINYLTLIALILFLAALSIYPMPSVEELAFWIVLAIIGESLFIVLPGPQKAGLSVAAGVSTAAIIIGGPVLCSVTTLIGFIFRTERQNGKYRILLLSNPYFKNAFNCAQITITEIIISVSYIYFINLIKPQNVILNVLVATIIVTIRSLINSVLMTTLFFTINRQPFIKIWKGIFGPMILPYITIGFMGVALGFGYLSFGNIAVLLFFGPIMLTKLCIKYYLKIREVSSEINNAQN